MATEVQLVEEHDREVLLQEENLQQLLWRMRDDILLKWVQVNGFVVTPLGSITVVTTYASYPDQIRFTLIAKGWEV